MADPRRVAPPLPNSTPAALRRTRGHHRPLPEDLLREASLRLGIMSLLAAVLWAVGSLLGHIAYAAMDTAGTYRWFALVMPTDAIALVSIGVSLALFVYTRKSRRSPAFILDLGLAYMVVMALALALLEHLGLTLQADQMAHHRVRPEISWIGAVVLMFAAILPSTPVKTLIAGLVAASMNPVAMLISKAQGTWDFGPPTNALLMHYPDYLLVGVAVVISHVVTQLGRQVTKAREMGSYQLGELIGRGGMGEVYKATHRMLARPAAIKLIRPEMVGAAGEESADLAVKRFYREAETAASLRSPHTVEIYDFGVTEDGTLYFVMELLEGLDLESLVRQQGALPAGRVIHIVRQVCESLEEAHLRGLVHRDIKPANIHVGQIGVRRDFVKVLDFGLVKATAGDDGRPSHHSLATVAGMAVGTPAYMPPEMALGEPVDGRADIYALGCVAYYLLTGQIVFEAENTLQMVAKHMQAEPVPPSERAELPIPPALERVVLACLAKDPKRRPQSAAELARSLAAIEVEPWREEQALWVMG
jgi:tRNA A-37 threonylcarbamoyl transferase component Bud32